MVNDFLNDIYNVIKDLPGVKRYVNNRIAFYEYKGYEDESMPFIVLRPLEAPMTHVYGNDSRVRAKQDIQIDIQVTDRKIGYLLMDELELALQKELNVYAQSYQSIDEYLDGVGRYVLAKRFRIKSKYNV